MANSRQRSTSLRLLLLFPLSLGADILVIVPFPIDPFSFALRPKRFFAAKKWIQINSALYVLRGPGLLTLKKIFEVRNGNCSNIPAEIQHDFRFCRFVLLRVALDRRTATRIKVFLLIADDE